MYKDEGWITYRGEDATCTVICPCKREEYYKDNYGGMFVSDHKVYRCPHCGRGYRTEHILWVYAEGEKDPRLEEEYGKEYTG